MEIEQPDIVLVCNTSTGIPYPGNGLAVAACQLDRLTEANTHLIHRD